MYTYENVLSILQVEQPQLFQPLLIEEFLSSFIYLGEPMSGSFL